MKRISECGLAYMTLDELQGMRRSCGRISSRQESQTTPLLKVHAPITVFRLMTILVENHHSFLILEHDIPCFTRMQKRWRVWDPLPEADLRGGDVVTGPNCRR